MQSIQFDNVSFGYQKGQLLFNNISFRIADTSGTREGHVVALMGGSGNGKSTLMKLILDTLQPNVGSIAFGAEPVISYLPQEAVLFEHLSPMANARYFSTVGRFKKRFNELLFNELAESLQITDLLKSVRSVQTLSGGQQQRVTLLRAMAIQPDILLLDEPTTGLDADVKLLFLSKLREIISRFNLLVVYVTHHRLEAEIIADEIIFLAKDSQTEMIDRIYQDKLTSFVKRPPLLEAVKVFKYPQPNIMECRLQDSVLLPCIDCEDSFYITVDPQQVSYTESGLAIDTVVENALYVHIRLKGTEGLLTIERSLYRAAPCLVLNGDFIVFDKQGRAGKTIHLQQNRITHGA